MNLDSSFRRLRFAFIIKQQNFTKHWRLLSLRTLPELRGRRNKSKNYAYTRGGITVDGGGGAEATAAWARGRGRGDSRRDVQRIHATESEFALHLSIPTNIIHTYFMAPLL